VRWLVIRLLIVAFMMRGLMSAKTSIFDLQEAESRSDLFSY
jgi:hypothetical protein